MLNLGIGISPGTSNTLPSGVPNGYLKAVFFDKEGNVQAAESQIKFLQTSVSTWQTLEMTFTASQNGYLQVYVANESDQEVFFDDLEVAHTPTLIAQENHYYLYGMNMVGIEKQRMPHNRFQFNAQTERETAFNLHWDETPFRRYDAQIGRFHGVDALASNYAGITPYQYRFNNPVMFNDPTGLLPDATASFGSPGSTFIDEWAAGQAGGSHLQNDFGGNEDVNAFITVNDLMGTMNPVILGYQEVVDGNTTYHNLPVRGFEFDLKKIFTQLLAGSKTFRDLAKKANVTLDNFDKNVLDNNFEYPQNTFTGNNGLIYIYEKKSKTETALMIEIAYEMYNRANIKVLHDATQDVTFGQIKPTEFAKKLIDFEKHGILVQIKVQAEMGISRSKKFDNLVRQYLSGEVSGDQILRATEEGMMKTHYPQYLKTGKRVRNAFLKELRIKGKGFEVYRKRQMKNGYIKIRANLGIKD